MTDGANPADPAVIASEEGIADMDGDETFSAADLDASSAWNLVASDDGNLLVEHPGGIIELEGLGFDAALSFAVLVKLGAVEVAA